MIIQQLQQNPHALPAGEVGVEDAVVSFEWTFLDADLRTRFEFLFQVDVGCIQLFQTLSDGGSQTQPAESPNQNWALDLPE